MDLLIVSGDLEGAVGVSKEIPEFDSPYNIDEYENRLDESASILTAEFNYQPIGFKWAMIDLRMDHFIVGWEAYCRIIDRMVWHPHWQIIKKVGQ